MKTTLLIFCSILLLFSCKKYNIQHHCCQDPHIEQYIDSAYLVAPNIFTPDGNNVNERFTIRTKNLASISITVFNKKDQTVWQESYPDLYALSNSGYANPGKWDGKHSDGKWKGKAIDGNYRFVIDATTVSGHNLHGEGNVAVISDPSKYCLKEMGTCFFPDGTNGKTEKTFKCPN